LAGTQGDEVPSAAKVQKKKLEQFLERNKRDGVGSRTRERRWEWKQSGTRLASQQQAKPAKEWKILIQEEEKGTQEMLHKPGRIIVGEGKAEVGAPRPSGRKKPNSTAGVKKNIEDTGARRRGKGEKEGAQQGGRVRGLKLERGH